MTDISTFRDALLSSRERTPEGFMRAMASIAKVGILEYAPSDFSASILDAIRAENGGSIPKRIRVLMTDASLFDEKTRESLALKPVTLEHPRNGSDVTPASYRRNAVGHMGEMARREGDRLTVPIMLTDAAAIGRIESGKAEMSIGYEYGLRVGRGTYNGEEYDAMSVTPIDINHVAIVDAGRAGPTVRIHDSEGTGMDMTEEKIRDIIVQAVRDAAKPDESDAVKDRLIDIVAGDALKPLMDRIRAADTAAEEARTELEELRSRMADAESEEARAEAEKTMIARVNDRANVLISVQPMVTAEEFERIRSLDTKAILVSALKGRVQDADSKSEDALRGALDMVVTQRAEDQASIARRGPEAANTNYKARSYRSFLDLPKRKEG